MVQGMRRRYTEEGEGTRKRRGYKEEEEEGTRIRCKGEVEGTRKDKLQG